MARLARIVVPGLPHHVTQRGNRRQTIFFEDGDYALTRDLLAERCRKAGVAVWAYCLMPDHVHLILVPATANGLALALGETHRRYAGFVNARLRVTRAPVSGPRLRGAGRTAPFCGCAHCRRVAAPCRRTGGASTCRGTRASLQLI